MAWVINARESPQPTWSAQLQPIIVTEIVLAPLVDHALPGAAVDDDDRFDRYHHMRSRWIRRPTIGADARLVVVPEDRGPVLEPSCHERLQPVCVHRLRFERCLSPRVTPTARGDIDCHIDAPPTAIGIGHWRT